MIDLIAKAPFLKEPVHLRAYMNQLVNRLYEHLDEDEWANLDTLDFEVLLKTNDATYKLLTSFDEVYNAFLVNKS